MSMPSLFSQGAAEALLDPLRPLLAPHVATLEALLGSLPPLRVELGALEPGRGAVLSAAGALILDERFAHGGGPLPEDAALLERGLPAMDRAGRLGSSLIEGLARWALTLRTNLAPSRLPHLEAAGHFAWAGAGAWLARKVGVDPGPAEVWAARLGEGVPLAAWDRAGWILWSSLEAGWGFGSTLDRLEGCLAWWAAGEVDIATRLLAERGADAGWARATALVARSFAGGAAVGLEAGASLVATGAGPALWVAEVEAGGPGNPVVVSTLGGHARVEAPGGWRDVRGAFIEGGRLLLSTEGPGLVSVTRQPSALLGEWIVRGADWAGRVFGVRGIVCRVLADGRLELDLADAFAGSLTGEGITLAERVGVSGGGRGRWRVDGETLTVSELGAETLTLHSRSARSPVAFPSGDIELQAAFIAQAVCAVPWRVAVEGDTVRLHSVISGQPATLRLGRDLPEADPHLPEA